MLSQVTVFYLALYFLLLLLHFKLKGNFPASLRTRMSNSLDPESQTKPQGFLWAGWLSSSGSMAAGQHSFGAIELVRLWKPGGKHHCRWPLFFPTTGFNYPWQPNILNSVAGKEIGGSSPPGSWGVPVKWIWQPCWQALWAVIWLLSTSCQLDSPALNLRDSGRKTIPLLCFLLFTDSIRGS